MSQRDSIRWEIDQALKQNACPICWVSQKSVQRFLDGLLYENVNDPGIRRHMPAVLGFCNRHAWQVRREGRFARDRVAAPRRPQAVAKPN